MNGTTMALSRDATDRETNWLIVTLIICIGTLTVAVIWQRAQLENANDVVQALWKVIREGHF